MPMYEYVCPANGRRVEVRHPMSQQIKTWGQLCQAAAISPGKTPESSEVRREISGGYVMTSGSDGPGIPSGGCGSGRCGCH